MSLYPHVFEIEIARHDVGSYGYTVVYLPPALAAELAAGGAARLRARGEVDDVPFAGAWQRSHGRWFLMLSKELLRTAGRAVGDRVEVRFRLDDPEAVDVPAELAAAVAENARARRAWDELTAGRRRGLSHHVNSAKSAATRAARVADVIAGLLGKAELPGPPARTRAAARPRGVAAGRARPRHR